MKLHLTPGSQFWATKQGKQLATLPSQWHLRKNSRRRYVPDVPVVVTHLLRQPSKQQWVPVKHSRESSHWCFSDLEQGCTTGPGHLTVEKQENSNCTVVTQGPNLHCHAALGKKRYFTTLLTAATENGSRLYQYGQLWKLLSKIWRVSHNTPIWSIHGSAVNTTNIFLFKTWGHLKFNTVIIVVTIIISWFYHYLCLKLSLK